MSIAIAGSGDVARYLTEELRQSNLPVVILTRQKKPQFDLPGTTQQVVDFNSVPALVAALNSNNVVALVSTILDYTASSFIQAHENLVQACTESAQCKRFIPSEYAGDLDAYPNVPEFYYATREPIRRLLREQSELEWTLVCCGWFINYVVPSRNRYLKEIGDLFPVNLAERRMVIPGTGNELNDVVAVRDLARALVALVQAPAGTWERFTYVSGEKVSWNQVAKQVKEKYPQLDFDVQYVSLQQIADTIRDAPSEWERIDAEYKSFSVSNAGNLDPVKVQRHRQKYFAGIRFRTVQEVLDAPDQEPDIVV